MFMLEIYAARSICSADACLGDDGQLRVMGDDLAQPDITDPIFPTLPVTHFES